MKTTPIYRVLAENATLLVAYVSENRAVYELQCNPVAHRVELGNLVLAIKDPMRVKKMVAVYTSVTNEVRRVVLPYPVDGDMWRVARENVPPVDFIMAGVYEVAE